MQELRLIKGNGSINAKKKADKEDFLSDRYLHILADKKNYANLGKVVHAGVRWFALRDSRGTLDTEAEYNLHNMILLIIAQNFSPEWIAREFPAEKDYRGHRWQCKDYFSCMEVLQGSSPFNGDTRKVLEFLWEWHNWTTNEFVLTGINIIDDIRAEQGEPSCMEEFLRLNGVTMHKLVTTKDGKQFLIDDDGQVVGKVSKHIPRYLREIKKNA